MVIYYVSHPNNDMGGHISHAVGIIEGFVNLGEKVIIVSRNRLPVEATQKVEYEIVDLYDKLLKIPFIGRLLWDIKCFFRIRHLYKVTKPHFIYTRFSVCSFSNPLIIHWITENIVLEVNTAAIQMAKNSLQKIIARFIDRINLSGAKIVLPVSKALKKVLCHEYPNYYRKFFISPNAVNPDFFSPKPKSSDLSNKYRIMNQDVVIGFSGKFLPYHGILLLLDSFKEIKDTEKNRKCWLLLIGDGEMENEINEYIAENHIKDVVITGEVPFNEVPNYLALCDILVSPLLANSKWLSSIKVFEYMAMGKCIVASSLGQQREIIINGKNGLLFEPGNVESLKSVLLKVLNNRELAEKLGKQAREDVCEYHTWIKRAENILNAFKNYRSSQ